ncbi:hypothetical protein P9112_008059 [Eukaryota sp. TZLM1-RC]
MSSSPSIRPNELAPLIKSKLPLYVDDPQNKDDNKFSSERGFVISTCAASVGLGNVVRFPYIVYRLGGATYIFAQIVTLFCIAFPFMFLETSAGRLAQGSVVKTYRYAHKKLGPIQGWFVVLLTFAITSYLLVITGWTAAYSFDAISGNLQIFDDFSEGFRSLYWFAFVTVLCGIILVKGVKALEKLCTVLIPVLMVLLVVLVCVASLTTGEGWTKTQDFVFNVDWKKLKSLELWFFAFGQAFYTLAVGQGYLETYGSLLPDKINIPRASIIVGVTQLSVSLSSIFVIFPFVFNSAETPAAGLELAFNVLPKVFPTLKGGYILSNFFFLLFFLAAFSSSLAGMKVVINSAQEEFKMSNKTAVLLTTILCLALGTPSALSSTKIKLAVNGESFIDLMDRFTGTTAVISSAVIGSLLICLFVDRSKIKKALGAKSEFWSYLVYFVSFVTPFFVLGYYVAHYFF